jgi:hypothetical protein
VGGKSVTNGDDMRRALAEARACGKHNILMRVKSANATRFIPLPLSEDECAASGTESLRSVPRHKTGSRPIANLIAVSLSQFTPCLIRSF